jgi:hypothetical protein
MAPKCRSQPTADRLAPGNSVAVGQPDESPEDSLQSLPPQVIDSGDNQLYRDVEKLHLLGPRPVYELLIELGRALLIRVQIERLVARYAQLDAATVRFLQGDKFRGRSAMCCHPTKCYCTVPGAASADAVSHGHLARYVGAERVAIPGRIEPRLDDIGTAQPRSLAKRKPHGR